MSDSLDLAGVIGTWVAAFFALIALISIIAVLQLWNKTRIDQDIALDAVQDLEHEFIHDGYRFGTNVRVFRSVNVPRLDSFGNCGESPDTLWMFNGPPKNQKFQSGWAKFCVLLEAYRSQAPATGPPRGGGNPKSADLSLRLPKVKSTAHIVFKERTSWLPVDVDWILAVGLLGRYGNRPDKGKSLIKDGRKRSLPHEEYYEQRGGGGPIGFNRDREPFCFSEQCYGMTGVLGRISENELWFDLNNDTGKHPDETISLKDLFWLAHGFMPGYISAQNTLSPFCLQDPPLPRYEEDSVDKAGKQIRIITHKGELLKLPHVYNAVPGVVVDTFEQSLRVAATAEAFNKPDRLPSRPLEIRHFVEKTFEVARSEEDLKSIRQHYFVEFKGGSQWMPLPKRPKHLVRKTEIHKLLRSLLAIEWNRWGFLVKKKECDIWCRLLEDASSNYGKNLKGVGGCQTLFGPPENVNELRGQIVDTSKYSSGFKKCSFDQRLMSTLVSLDTELRSLWPPQARNHILVAILFIADNDFRGFIEEHVVPKPEEMVFGDIKYILQNDGHDEKRRQLYEEWERKKKEEKEANEKRLEELRAKQEKKKAEETKRKKEEVEFQKAVKRFPHLLTELIETLETHLKQAGPNESIAASISKEIDADFEDIAKEEDHSSSTRNVPTVSNQSLQTPNPIEASFAISIKPATATSDATATLSVGGSSDGPLEFLINLTLLFPGEDFQHPSNVHPETINKDDVLFACLWAQTRCRLWLHSLDSDFLLEFIDNLSEGVLVGPMSP